MKIALDLGHGVGTDRGASGFIAEETLINSVGKLLKPALEKLGHEVKLVRPPNATTVIDSLNKRCETSNDWGANLYLSIHANASDGQGHGTEVYAISPRGKSLAQEVVNNLAKLGFTNRGVKDGSRLYVLRNTDAPAILVEVCFCDSEIDTKLFEGVKVADAIASAIN